MGKNRPSTTGRARGGRRSAPAKAVPVDPAHGTEVELDISNVAHGGVFVARHEGRVIFVPDTIPGERIRARISETTHASFWRAETVQVLDASEHRVAHVWAEAGIDRAPSARVGGAEFGHIDLRHQRTLKRAVIEDAFARFAKIPREIGVEAVPGDDESRGTGWRTRTRLHVGDDGRVGPYAARSHEVIDVAELPLATAAISAAAPLGDRLQPGSTVDLVDVRAEGRVAVVVRGAEEKPDRSATTTIVEAAGGREFRLDRLGFWQVHRHAAEVLTRAVQEALDTDLIDPRAANQDLYGGVGLLAAAVGDRIGETLRITSVESDPRATEHALDNLAEWIGGRAVTARVDRYLVDAIRNADAVERARWRSATVVLDPPRSGAGREVTDALAELAPAQLIYVACDPVALARDVGRLVVAGYELDEVRGYDLFPNTHHLEAVARLRRA
ncbi:class I SAM-dependent RNA methyltransferase [Microbacteriaceae bacterium VKM Ac-2854]|nr:class I SAM-dependent RNA methyltransferase [Microbacteriaceae bacterium VKM Ac-2854]